MKRKIWVQMCLLTMVTIVLSLVLISCVMFTQLFHSLKESVKVQAGYISSAMNLTGEQYLANCEDTNYAGRVTWIAKDGKVIFDNTMDAAAMPNHSGRPEITDAVKNGFGEAERTSDTLGSHTYYYAVQLEDGTILRVSDTTDSVLAMLWGYLPYGFLIAIVVFALAMLLAQLQTKKIVVPINSLNLENPELNDVYDELSPLLTRLAKQKKQIEGQLAELNQKQKEFSDITQNMSEGLIILNEKSMILSINQSALHIFNVRKAACLHQHILTVNRSKKLQTAVEKALAGESNTTGIEADGRRYELMANPVWLNDTVCGCMLLLPDVTEKHAAEQMRREFSANVSHELKTPLTSISGYAEIIKNGLVKQEDIPRFITCIYNETQRLIVLIDDIIRLSRLDESADDMQMESVDLNVVAHDVCHQLLPLAQRKNISLQVTGEKAVVQGIPHILQEMVTNICENAIKYNRENGSVTVIVKNTEKQVELTVADTGIGIPPEHQSRVFERFYRVDKSHSKETGGTGLGLSIVKHGAQLHHAKMKLESIPGKGTTFYLFFPKEIHSI